jgi:nicotinamide-nucleotide amidase
VDVRIAAKASTNEEAGRLIAPVEGEVRKLLGRHVFAEDDETIESTVGGLLREANVSIAVYEDLTAGLVAERLQQASTENFVEAVIGNGLAPIRRLLAHSRRPKDAEDLLGEPASMTDELAWAVRAMARSDIGLALHAVPDPDERAENLARGKTFVSVTDGTDFRNRAYSFGGRGRPDRTRMSFNAVELVRGALLEGFR